MPWNGFAFESDAKPPTSDEIVALQGRYYQHAIELFGAERCMFESNFPVDKDCISDLCSRGLCRESATQGAGQPCRDHRECAHEVQLFCSFFCCRGANTPTHLRSVAA